MKRLAIFLSYVLIAGAAWLLADLNQRQRIESLGPSITTVDASRGAPSVVVRVTNGLYKCRLGERTGIKARGFGCSKI